MAAKNDHTGDLIISRMLSKQGRINHDRIYAKKSAYEWLEDECAILDSPNGWEQDDGVTLDTLISYQDFCFRASLSTIISNV
jgi:hypothetical protein